LNYSTYILFNISVSWINGIYFYSQDKILTIKRVFISWISYQFNYHNFSPY